MSSESNTPPLSSALEYDDSNHLAFQSTMTKSASINNYLPTSRDLSNQDTQVGDQLYEEGHYIAFPKHLHVSKLSNLIPMDTIFDKQAKLGKFSIHDLTEELSKINVEERESFISNYSQDLMEFSAELLECLELRDKYQTLSGQTSYTNPVNLETWETYPPPLPKGWHYNDEYDVKRDGFDTYYYDETVTHHYYGENFKMEDYEKFYRERNPKSEQVHEVYFDKKSHTYQITNFDHDALPKFSQYFKDLNRISKLSINKVGTSLSYRRLSYLHAKFEQYNLLYDDKEIEISKLNPHRDFYNVRKIDNNVDVSMCMSRKALLNVINSKLEKESDRVVYEEGDVKLTLEELFEPYFNNELAKEEETSHKQKKKRLNIDDLFEFGIIDRNFEVLEQDILHKNLKIDEATNYDHIISDEILVRIDRTFLRIDNAIGGEYLAELIKQVCSDYERTKYQYGELGLHFNMIPSKWYQKNENLEEGLCFSRWDSIADWVIDNKLISHNVKWIIRIPRNYSILKKIGKVSNFQDYLDAIFKPLFEISVNPEKNLKLHYFLTKVSALDLLSGSFNKIQDISLFEHRNLRPPSQWRDDTNPPYSYYLYYIFLNLSHLNKFRQSKSLNCMCLRNHVSSVSEVHSGLGIITETLSSNFLIAKNIINGERLEQYPTLQYLYYLKQIGITMSPLCWNKSIQILNDDERYNTIGASNYELHPCIKFFKTGMKVALSTDKPLFSSLTRDPLIEEYSIAGSIHKLGTVDLCELTRNSVLISGFNGSLKRHWVGVKYVEEIDGLDWEDSDDFAVQRSNVPNMRVNFRRDAVKLEYEFIRDVANTL